MSARQPAKAAVLVTPIPSPGMDWFPPEVVQLLARAQEELALHMNGHGRCAACGLSWPCERAAVAAFVLGAI